MTAGILLGRLAPPEMIAVTANSLVVGCWLAVLAWVAAPRSWFLDLLRHFPMQLLLASLAAAGAAWSASGLAPGWRAAAALAPLPWAAAVLPWLRCARLAATTEVGGVRLRVFYANVLTESRAYGQLTTLIAAADADLVALVEVDREWLDRLPLEALGYTDSVSDPRPAHFGLALFSRRPLVGPRVVDLAGQGMPAVSAGLDLGTATLHVVLAHTMPPKGPARARMRDRQLAAAANVVKGDAAPCVLLGDLNVTPWSTAYARLLRAAGLSDGRAGHGLCPTWPARLPSFLRLPIDCVLVTPGIRCAAVHVGPPYGSDHRPMTLDIEVYVT